MTLKNSVSNRYTVEAGPLIDIRTGKEIKKGSKPKGSPPKSTDPIKNIIAALETLLSFSFSNQDDLIDIDEEHRIDASEMDEEEYAKMEAELKKAHKNGPGYEVYAWNDASGYDYWRNEGEESNNYNYIKVTARIKRAESVDVNKLADDMGDLYHKVSHWDNV